MKDLAKLKAACDAVIADPKLRPILDPNTGQIVTTFCNFGAMRVAHAMGCDELQGLTADNQYAVMNANKSGLWIKVQGLMAAGLAQQGCLVFAAMTAAMLGEAHGHIAAVAPVPMQFSGSLNRSVPCVANVGATTGIMKSSQAFPVSKGETSYFAWDG